MADSEVLKKLKDIPFKIQTASLKERRKVIEEIEEVLSTPGITEPAVRFVSRVVLLTLQRYRDSTSQSYVKKLLVYLSVNHRDWALKSILPLLLEISEQLKNTATSKNICQSGLYALRWTTVLVNGPLKTPDDDGIDYNTLVLTQANLVAVVSAFGDKRKNDKAYSILHNSWQEMDKGKLTNWMNVLLAQAPDSGPQVCATFSVLCRHAKSIGDESFIKDHKAKMLESLIKSLITVKTRPNANYIKSCVDLLTMLDKSDVQDTLLPALQKAMLRSPETIVEAVGEVFEYFNCNVDGVAVDIGKSLISCLHSRDGWVREEAGRALSRVARRCGAEPSKALLTHVFAEYNGAGGKLTSSEDKIAVLNGVGCMSASADASALWGVVATQTARVLDSESHERTLCAALLALQRWVAVLRQPLPAELLDMYKKTMTAKSMPTAVRVAYTSLVSHALRHGAPPTAAAALSPSLLAAADRAAQQPHQPASEGVCALAALAQLGGPEAAARAPLLLQDRSLAAATDDGNYLIHTNKYLYNRCNVYKKLLRSIRVHDYCSYGYN